MSVVRVNGGPSGMAARTRWLLSPDGRAILAMEDPAGVEAEPVLNGIAFASERSGTVLQIDGVWDASPSPDWSRLAIGRGFVMRGGESDSIPNGEWTRLEKWLPQDVAAPSIERLRAELRPHLFPASGMAYMWGIGLTQVIDLSRYGAGRAPVVEGPTLALDGWRVRWTRSGDSLAVGSAPVRVQDDANSTRWTVSSAVSGQSSRVSGRALSDSTRLDLPRWTEGPTIDISIAVDLRAPKLLELSEARVESRDGMITRTVPGGVTQVVGPGLVLAATASGQFILALRPRENAGEFDPKVELVLYTISGRLSSVRQSSGLLLASGPLR